MSLKLLFSGLIIASLAATVGPARSQEPPEAPESPRIDPGPFDRGRLLATSGVSQLEGAAGGGLVPWAVIAGPGSRDGAGFAFHGTIVRVPKFSLTAAGVALGVADRVEVSATRQWFDTGSAGRELGLGSGFDFRQDVLGLKVRLFGDLVADQDRWWPQLAVGIQGKANNQGEVVRAVGAKRDQDVDFYVAATKLFLSESLLVNGTVRFTRANQTGLLGFGGDRNDKYEPMPEVSVAWLATRQVAFGAEYRMKPNNLGFADESDWFDVFAAVFLTKEISATLAYADLGSVAGLGGQRGFYLSLQAAF